MKTTTRVKCEITGTEDLEHLHTFRDFPVFMGCVETSSSEDLMADMTWEISKSSGFIQLKELLPLDILYMENHSGSIGKNWEDHHTSFANFIHQFSPKSVLEIGGAHGILSKKYHEIKSCDWTIIEPNPIPIEGVKAKFIKGFFDDKFVFDKDLDAVVHSHVFEHIYHPNTFIEHISNFLKNGKRLIFTLPNMKEMLERRYTNCINFEHTIFLTEPYIEFLLTKHKLKIEKKEYFLEDHSIFYSVIKDDSVEAIRIKSDLYESNKNLFFDFINYYKNLIDGINQKIEGTNQNIYLFGAHIFTQYLIGFGLNLERVNYILDNDPKKQEKRLYGTEKLVKSPRILKKKSSNCNS